MITNYCIDQYSIIVSASIAESAAEALKRNDSQKVICKTTSTGNISLEPRFEMFDQYTYDKARKEATRFIKKYCKPGSFISFRNDDLFEYAIVYKRTDGSVLNIDEEFINPFQNLIDRIEADKSVYGAHSMQSLIALSKRATTEELKGYAQNKVADYGNQITWINLLVDKAVEFEARINDLSNRIG